MFYPLFVYIKDEKKHTGQCFAANLDPFNEEYNSYFNILKDPNYNKEFNSIKIIINAQN